MAAGMGAPGFYGISIDEYSCLRKLEGREFGNSSSMDPSLMKQRVSLPT